MEIEKEIWVPYIRHPEMTLSNLGNVRNAHGNPRKLNTSLPYLTFGVKNRGVPQKNRYVHLAVLESFTGFKENGAVCNHKNGNKRDNRLVNLEWTTQKRNMQHAFETGLICRAGNKNSRHKIKEHEVIELRQIHRMYGLNCTEAAKQFGVRYNTIHAIINEITWKHV